MTEGELSALPFETPRPKRLRSEIRVFTFAEMLRLRDLVRTENVRDWAIFMLLLDTGMRTGELCRLAKRTVLPGFRIRQQRSTFRQYGAVFVDNAP